MIKKSIFTTILFLTKICLILGINYNIFAASKDIQYNYNYKLINDRCRIYDPYESFNRKIFFVNGVIDTFIFRPVAITYDKVTNGYTKSRVKSFISNIGTPVTTLNYMIQGDSEGTFKSFWRFMINSTVGIGGLFDVASKVGLKVKSQNLGSTLAHYGVGPGPYVVLPIFGSSTMRDAPGRIGIDSLTNIVKYPLHSDFKLAVLGIGDIDHRAQILPFTDYVTKNSTDPYITVRDAFFQNRESKILYPENFRCPTVD
ncbi:MAG: VacJ family lipoprotein [Rickettsiaceae bacterium]|nr:VacJ family lipoprotein [Rickettsiaceae bacterium]